MIASLWLATVAGASTVTWGVISVTGTQVGQTTPVAQQVISAHPSGTPTSGHPSPPSTTHPSKPHASTSPTSHRTTDEPAPPPTTETWSGEQGKVTASCTGNAISLVSAMPNVGYRVQVEKEGGRILAIEFEATDGSEDYEAHLKATCEDGTPIFHREY